ncbi:MAG: TIGR03936 family radical SAM-associated protein [Treponema sp.]|nr:TIGR03936 family radical SAM-associated protein [Treponema sp.]
MKRFIDPVVEFGASLLSVEKPARYVGGEFGRLAGKDSALQTLIAFPDLYEIGMSNQAMRIIYNGLNRITGISCDRAFAPAPDFEQLLQQKVVPLYGLDTGIRLKDLDLLLFTLGYELGAGGILSMLDLSGIPLHRSERGADDPVVIAGGPAVSNPLPYSPFVDAFWIGEAEAGFFGLAAELLEMKRQGQGRGALLERITAHPNIWAGGKDKAVRAVDSNFAERGGEAAVFPVPGMKIIHPHGAIEIMRGCPNGCRFCHAGFWYRPQREKKSERILAEAEALVNRGGWHEISLSSLSSGDYSGIENLVDTLNGRFGGQRVSFQLPSLKIETFSLALLEKISQTRRSGLTFAVETPVDLWQLSINKQVLRDSVVNILREAKRHGWRGAKFYFMIGLPVTFSESTGAEETEIVNFIIDIAHKTSMHFNINVGIFVPKPHTPYQWAAQINSEAAAEKLNYIKTKLRPMGHKVSVSEPLISMLEGVLSRGDERAGDWLLEAWQKGSRLDAWSEYINRPAWLSILEKNRDTVNSFLGEKNTGLPLPWSVINAGVSSAYLQREAEKSLRAEVTPACVHDCAAKCGVCGSNAAVTKNRDFVNHKNSMVNETKNSGPEANLSAAAVINSDTTAHVPPEPVNHEKKMVNSNKSLNKSDPPVQRILFTFCKEGGAVFHGHLSLVEIFSMAFLRAGLPVLYTQGFNPLAKIEIAAPLSTGIAARAEMAAADFTAPSNAAESLPPLQFTERLNASLPEGIRVQEAASFFIPAGHKKYSLSSLLWGFAYPGTGEALEYIPAAGEKQFRHSRLNGGPVFYLRREAVLAKNIIEADTGPARPWAPYFDVYRFLYPAAK